MGCSSYDLTARRLSAYWIDVQGCRKWDNTWFLWQSWAQFHELLTCCITVIIESISQRNLRVSIISNWMVVTRCKYFISLCISPKYKWSQCSHWFPSTYIRCHMRKFATVVGIFSNLDERRRNFQNPNYTGHLVCIYIKGNTSKW